MPSQSVELTGHILDSLTLPKILDLIISSSCDYEIIGLHLGHTNRDSSNVSIRVTAPSQHLLDAVLSTIRSHGAIIPTRPEAVLVECIQHGVLPDDFYSSTNLPTKILVGGHWIQISYPEMDCAILFDPRTESARCVPIHAVRIGDLVVTGTNGIEIEAPSKGRNRSIFEFMGSDNSPEKPKGLVLNKIADRMMNAHSGSKAGKILVVCGPAIIHTGAGPALSRLVRQGWVDIIFAGNGFATHDIESSLFGTSLGVSLSSGESVISGHSNHLRAINAVRKFGSIRAAVEMGLISSGVMYECVKRNIPFVLAGSLRDDGPLPDVIANVTDAADQMRSLVPGVTVALMLASTLHAIATGNLLSAQVETFCVDINQSVVTKLGDRGSHQALGIVTDVGLFVHELATILCPMNASGSEK